MKALIQRVSRASVTVENEIISKISNGYLILFGVEKDDDEKKADFLAKKISKLRAFTDENGKMNKSIKDINGQVIVVSQFTLAANCQKGNRPSFDTAAPPDVAIKLYEHFISTLRSQDITIQTGKFGANMQVELINDGPVTFMIEK